MHRKRQGLAFLAGSHAVYRGGLARVLCAGSCVTGVILAIVAGLPVLARGDASPKPRPATQAITDLVFPGAAVSFVAQTAAQAGRQGWQLTVQLPSRVRAPRGSRLQRSFAYEKDNWRMLLLVPFAERSETKAGTKLVSFQLEYPNNNAGVPRVDRINSLSGLIEHTFPGDRDNKLDSVSYRTARRQVRASMATLDRALGGDKLRRYRISKLSLEASRRFAVVISLTVRRVSDVRRHLADIIDGLSTGLIGNGRTRIEGIQIVAKGTNGNLALGAWVAHRVDAASLGFSKSLRLPCVLHTTVRFPDLTHGPRTTQNIICG